MTYISQKQKNNPLLVRLTALGIGLILNSMGNGLTITSGTGSGIWTASAVNLNSIFGWSLGVIIFGFGLFNIVMNQLLIRHLDVFRLVGELIYTLFFSYLINFFTDIFMGLGLHKWNLVARIIMSIVGVTMFCIAISLYQRANIFMHPNDDMSNLLRFKLLNGSAVLSQFLDMSIPIVIIIICFIFTGRIESVGIGTIYSVLGNGLLIKTADRFIFPGLIHNFNKSDAI